MRPRTLLLLLLVLVLLVPVAGALGVWSIDQGYLRRLIVARVEQATGRTFTVTGPVGIDWSLHPTLTMQQLALANAPWGAEPAMLRVERLTLQVAALSLLSGRPDLERVTVQGADLLLETDPAGTGNWAFQPAAATAEPDAAMAEAGPLPSVRQVLLAAGRVRYRDGGSGATTDLRLDQAALDTTSGGATANLGLAGSLDGKPLRASGRLGALDAVLAGHGTPLTLTALALTLAGSDLAGSASLHLGGDRPRLEAELTAHRLDLRDLLPPVADPAPPAGATTLFPTTPLPLADLDRLDLQLHLRADTVATPALALDGVELTAALAAGRLKVAPLRFALLDRPVQGALEADAAPARLAVRLAGDDVDLGRLLAALAHTTLVEGRGDFRLQLEGQGASPHALAATASGRASVLMGPGRLPGQLLSGLAGGVRQLLGDLTAAGKAEPAGLRCAALDARAEAGVARLDLLLDTAYSTVVGGGTVDLGAERVDLTLTPQSKEVDLDLAVPVTIRGPLMAPTSASPRLTPPVGSRACWAAVFFPPAALGAFVDLGGARAMAAWSWRPIPSGWRHRRPCPPPTAARSKASPAASRVPAAACSTS